MLDSVQVDLLAIECLLWLLFATKCCQVVIMGHPGVGKTTEDERPPFETSTLSSLPRCSEVDSGHYEDSLATVDDDHDSCFTSSVAIASPTPSDGLKVAEEPRAPSTTSSAAGRFKIFSTSPEPSSSNYGQKSPSASNLCRVGGSLSTTPRQHERRPMTSTPLSSQSTMSTSSSASFGSTLDSEYAFIVTAETTTEMVTFQRLQESAHSSFDVVSDFECTDEDLTMESVPGPSRSVEFAEEAFECPASRTSPVDASAIS